MLDNCIRQRMFNQMSVFVCNKPDVCVLHTLILANMSVNALELPLIMTCFE